LLGPTLTAARTTSAKAISSRDIGGEVASIPERPRAICNARAVFVQVDQDFVVIARLDRAIQ